MPTHEPTPGDQPADQSIVNSAEQENPSSETLKLAEDLRERATNTLNPNNDPDITVGEVTLKTRYNNDANFSNELLDLIDVTDYLEGNEVSTPLNVGVRISKIHDERDGKGIRISLLRAEELQGQERPQLFAKERPIVLDEFIYYQVEHLNSNETIEYCDSFMKWISKQEDIQVSGMVTTSLK